MTTRISGPEPGYIACSIFVVQVAVGGWVVWGAGVLHAGELLGPAQLVRVTSRAAAANSVLDVPSTLLTWLRSAAQPFPHFSTPPTPQAAITLLEERDRLPLPGVHTPARWAAGGPACAVQPSDSRPVGIPAC